MSTDNTFTTEDTFATDATFTSERAARHTTISGTIVSFETSSESGEAEMSVWDNRETFGQVDVLATMESAFAPTSTVMPQSVPVENAGHQQAVAEVLAHPAALELLAAIVSTGEYRFSDPAIVEPLLRLANANLIFTADGRAFATLEALDLLKESASDIESDS